MRSTKKPFFLNIKCDFDEIDYISYAQLGLLVHYYILLTQGLSELITTRYYSSVPGVGKGDTWTFLCICKSKEEEFNHLSPK